MKFFYALAALYLGFSSFAALAQEESQRTYDLEASLYFRPLYVQNAAGTENPEEEIDETQTEIGATLEFMWHRERSQLDINYEAIDTRYHDESQPDDSRWTGESQWVFGNEATFYGLDLNHSVRRFLADPAASPFLLFNNVEREISHVSPSLKSRLGSANIIELAYHYTNIDFDADDSNDAERDGVELSLMRDISPTRNASINVGSRSIDFKEGDEAGDYELDTINVQMSVENRTYDYVLSAGYYEAAPLLSEETFSGAIGRLEITTRPLAGNELVFFALKEASDSSQGNGNNGFIGDQIVYNGDITQRDNTERRSYGVEWEYEHLCGPCDLSLSAGLDRYDYMTQDVNDFRTHLFNVRLAYNVSRFVVATLAFLKSDNEFVNPDALFRKTTRDTSIFTLAYQPQPNLRIRFELENDRRRIDERNQVTVNSISLATEYRF